MQLWFSCSNQKTGLVQRVSNCFLIIEKFNLLWESVHLLSCSLIFGTLLTKDIPDSSKNGVLQSLQFIARETGSFCGSFDIPVMAISSLKLPCPRTEKFKIHVFGFHYIEFFYEFLNIELAQYVDKTLHFICYTLPENLLPWPRNNYLHLWRPGTNHYKLRVFQQNFISTMNSFKQGAKQWRISSLMHKMIGID